MLSTSDILPHVEKVLLTTDNSLSAYQILDRLPVEVRDQLITERGMPGLGGGHPQSAATLVTKVAEKLVPSKNPPHRIYVDSVGITFRVAGLDIRAGDQAIAMYRLRVESSAD